VRVAVPVRPVELRISGNTAVPPGSTVAVVEPPVAGVMAMPTPVPVSATDCGLPAALGRSEFAVDIACSWTSIPTTEQPGLAAIRSAGAPVPQTTSGNFSPGLGQPSNLSCVQTRELSPVGKDSGYNPPTLFAN
jgi:hypothetical protein